MRRIATLSLLLATLTAALASTGCNPPTCPARSKLDDVARAIDTNLAALDADLESAAAQILQTGLDSTATRATLAALCANYPDAVDCATVSPEAILTAVEPAAYHDAEGAYIGDQAQVIALFQTQQPVMSGLFTAVEGFPALDFEYPLLADGHLVGSVSILFKPADYLGRLIAPVLEGTDYACNVLQLDGTILYHTNPTLAGRNTFTDPLFADYADLQQLAQRCVAHPAGMGSYEFPDAQTGEVVTKHARWTTVEFHGTQWRVLLITEAPAAAF